MYAASGLLAFAVARGYLSTNVVKNVKKVNAPRNPPRCLSFEEWKKVRPLDLSRNCLLTVTCWYALQPPKCKALR